MPEMLIDDSPETLEFQRKFAEELKRGNDFIRNMTDEQAFAWDPMDDYNDALDFAPAHHYKWFPTTREEKIMLGIDPDEKTEPIIVWDKEAQEFAEKLQNDLKSNNTDTEDCGGFENE